MINYSETFNNNFNQKDNMPKQRAQISFDFLIALTAGLLFVIIIANITDDLLDSVEKNSALIQNKIVLDKVSQLMIGKYLLSDATHGINYNLDYPQPCFIFIESNEIAAMTNDIRTAKPLDSNYTSAITTKTFYCGGVFHD